MQQARRKYPALCANLRMIQNKTHILRVRLEGSVCKSAEPVPFDGLSKALFRPAKQVEAWGRAYACMWLKLSGKVPDDLKKPYLLICNTGESLLYTQNGIPFDAVTSVWTNGDLPQSAGAARTAALPFAAGERFTLYADCGYNGFIPMDFADV